MLLVVAANISAQRADSQLRRAKIVGVETHEIETPMYLPGPAGRMPLTQRYYTHWITAAVECTSYTATYDSQFDFVPGDVKPGNSLPAEVTGHSLNLRLLDERTLNLHITRRTRDPNCR
jgi:hypothetical protein